MNRRAGLAAAVISLGVLAAVRGSGGGPPLYDGVCLPPQYTMLGANPGPPSRSQTFTASDLAGTFELADSDTNPQAQLIVGAGSLAPAPGSSTATVSITPVKPPAVKPADGTIDGNVYDFEARSGGQPVPVQPGHLVTIVLSATRTGGPQLAVQHFDGSRWSAPAKSVQSGCGTTYQVNSSTLGIFALVAQGATSPSNGPGGSGGGSGGGGAIIIIVIAVVLVLLAIVIGAVRMNRQRGRRGKRRRR
jgi:hypothetical protein